MNILTINIFKLKSRIDRFIDVGVTPYLVCSEQTIELLRISSNKEHDLFDESMGFQMFYGCKILIDNSLIIGCVDVR